mgnify:FL=1
MNNLTKSEFMKIYNEGENLTDKPIFISFYATWWGPCKMYERSLNEVTPEYKDKINLYKVNIEEELEMAGLFKVMSVPTTATISKSGDVQSMPGALNEETLKYFLEGLISK